MKTYGIRISDSKNDVLSVKIGDILQEIKNGSVLKWCILFLDGTPNKGEGLFVNDYKRKINELENGFQLDYDDLLLVSEKFSQIFEIIILGSNSKNKPHHYRNDQEMYRSCDIVIELIDCSFWQVFSKDHELTKRLREKFNEIEFLEPNFQK